MRSIAEINVDINAAIAVSKTHELQRLAAELREHVGVEAEMMEAHTLGIMQSLSGDAIRSIEHHQRVLALSEEQADVAWIARANGNIGNGYLVIGETAKALEHFERALTIHRDIGDNVGVARGIVSIGNLHQQIGDYAAAMDQYAHALEMQTQRGDQASIALITGNIGSVYARTGDQSLALEHYRRSLAIYEELDNPAGIARLLNSVGNVYHTISDYPAALEYFHRAQAVYHEVGDRSGVAGTISNIGLVYADTGEHAKAIEHYRNALDTYEEVGDMVGYVITTANMASVYGNMDDKEQALGEFRRALELHQQMNDRPGISRITGRVARVLISMNDHAAAAELLDEQASMQMDDPEVRAEYLSNRSDLCIANDDLEGAHAFLLQALEIVVESGLRAVAADVHKHLRDLAQQRNDFATYIEHNNEYTRISEEISGKEATQRMAMMEAERKVEGERREREKERALLYGALPRTVADRMIRGEKVTGDHYDLATVIFVDIVGFTQISDSMEPVDVVLLLEEIFTQFDAICERYGVVKVKTIGDSYMAVAFESVVDAARCALLR